MQKRFDLVFSYWIFFWFLLYIFKFVTYNPKFMLILGLIENLILFIFMVYYGSNYKTLVYFIIINLFIKLLPYYSIRKTTIQYRDIYASLVLFLIYCVWLYINGIEVIKYENKIFQSLIHNKNQTPGLFLLNKMNEYLHNLYKN